MEKLEQTPMSDKVKERIEKDADEYVKRQGTHDRPDITKHDFIQGATAERPKAWNDAIDACIEKIKNTSAWTFANNSDRERQITELEQLKHKQP